MQTDVDNSMGSIDDPGIIVFKSNAKGDLRAARLTSSGKSIKFQERSIRGFALVQIL